MEPDGQWLLQKEKLLEWLRLGLAFPAVLLAQTDLLETAWFPLFARYSIYAFALYSSITLYLVIRKGWNAKNIALATTCLDLFWVSLIVISTRGSQVSFLVYFLLPVITGGFCYGLKGAISVAFLEVGCYAAAGSAFFSQKSIPIEDLILGSGTLFALAAFFGLISDLTRKHNQELSLLYETATQARIQEERHTIARELHDRVLQVLASFTLRIEACRRHFFERPQQLAGELEWLEGAARSSIKEIRRVIAGRENEEVRGGKIAEMLGEEIAFLREEFGLNVIPDGEPEQLSLPPAVEREIYYVVREGLVNIARHAHATQLRVSLRQTEKELKGSLQDNGTGFDPGLKLTASGHGYGLANMEDRIRKLGGTLSIRTGAGKGTEVSFFVPLSPSYH